MLSLRSSFNAGDHFVLCGFENDPVAQEVAQKLGKTLTVIKNGSFKDTSSNVKITVSSKNAFDNKRVHLIAGNSRGQTKSINDTTMEITLAISAAKTAGAKEIYLYIPHLGYARQDRASQDGEPVAAPLVLRMFEMAGANKITVLDIHNEEVFGAPGRSVVKINKFAMNVFALRFQQMKETGTNLDQLVVVAPDKGARSRAKLFREAMKDVGFHDIGFAYFDKSRGDFSVKGAIQSMELREVELADGTTMQDPASGLKGKRAIIVDDIADTCGTMLRAIQTNVVGKYEAIEAYAVITHGVFSGDALDLITRTQELTKILVTDSIPLRGPKPEKVEIVSCAPVFVAAINEDSLN